MATDETTAPSPQGAAQNQGTKGQREAGDQVGAASSGSFGGAAISVDAVLLEDWIGTGESPAERRACAPTTTERSVKQSTRPGSAFTRQSDPWTPTCL